MEYKQVLGIGLVAAVGYLAWLGYKKYKAGIWSWMPWKEIISRKEV